MKYPVVLFLALMLFFAGCSDDGGGDSSADADAVIIDNDDADAVTIDNAVADMDNYPADAEVIEPENLSVNGEKIEGTKSTQVDDTDKATADTAVTIPANLSRAGALTVVGCWLNGTYILPVNDPTPVLAELINALSIVIELAGGKVDTSVTDKVKIDSFPIILDIGENYVFFQFADSSGKKYRTPVIAINFK
ncbi:MAG: hypothetical protein PF637_10245 [Spirochaetes bacterium]|jgi:hypothetical protein|nr:hypothetical protein [Spirochaetota bacterium]